MLFNDIEKHTAEVDLGKACDLYQARTGQSPLEASVEYIKNEVPNLVLPSQIMDCQEHFCQGVLAKDGWGYKVQPEDKTAESFCVLGATLKSFDWTIPKRAGITIAFRRKLDIKAMQRGWSTAVMLNDNTGFESARDILTEVEKEMGLC